MPDAPRKTKSSGFLAARTVSERRYNTGLKLLYGELEKLIQASELIPKVQRILSRVPDSAQYAVYRQHLRVVRTDDPKPVQQSEAGLE